MSRGVTFLDSFARSAWRLETLPQYQPRTDASFRRYLETGEVPPLEERPGKRNWMAQLRAAVDGGKQLTQCHVVDRPLSDYLRYELSVYPENVAAGMRILIADRTDHPELAPLTSDWWLLDDETGRPRVQLMHYDQDGELLDREVTSDPEMVARCRHERDLALRYAVDLSEYLQRIG